MQDISKYSLLVFLFIAVGFIPLERWGRHAVGQVPEPYEFDFDMSGSIDAGDLILFLHHWGLENVVHPGPTPSPTPCENAFQGTYQGQFSGSDTGSASVSIDAMGNVSGSITSGPETSTVEGAVSLDGAFFANNLDGQQVIGVVFGTFSGNSGNGRWLDIEGGTGTWSVSRVPGVR